MSTRSTPTTTTSTATSVIDTENGGDYPAELYSFEHALAVDRAPEVWSAQELDSYRRHGFLAASDLVLPAQVTEALDALADLTLHPNGADLQFEAWAAERLGQANGEQRMDLVRKLMGFVAADERLNRVAQGPRLLTLVRQLLGAQDVVLLQDMALLKPPGGGREKPWHQDLAFFDLAPDTRVVGVWIALDEATPENGCLHLRPGSHLAGPRPHFRRRDWQLCDSDVLADRQDDPVGDLMVPLPVGGAVFFDGLIHHGTPTNRSRSRRRALQFHYVATGTAPVPEERRLQVFGGEGRGVTC